MKKIFVGILTFFLLIVLCSFSLASVAQDLAIKSMTKYAILPGLQGHLRNMYASANPYATKQEIDNLVAEIEDSEQITIATNLYFDYMIEKSLNNVEPNITAYREVIINLIYESSLVGLQKEAVILQYKMIPDKDFLYTINYDIQNIFKQKQIIKTFKIITSDSLLTILLMLALILVIAIFVFSKYQFYDLAYTFVLASLGNVILIPFFLGKILSNNVIFRDLAISYNNLQFYASIFLALGLLFIILEVIRFKIIDLIRLKKMNNEA